MTTVYVPNPRIAQLHVEVGSVAVLLWDILLHIPQDYTMMTTKKRVNISSLVYIIARLSGLAYVLGLVSIETALIGDCDLIRRVNFVYAVALPFTVLLLVFRVVALYMNSKYAVAFFGLSWLTFLANSIFVSMGVVGMQVGNTPYCVLRNSRTQSVLGAIAPIIHDTLVFMATTWVFMKNSYIETNLDVKTSFNIMVLGRHLPAFSKSLLRDGQFYFLAALIFNIFSSMIYFIPQSFVLPCAFNLPKFVLINTMACHVYRNVRLSMYRDSIGDCNFTAVLRGPSSPDQQIGIAFSPRRSRRSIIPTMDLEAARDVSNLANREEVDVVERARSREA